MAGSLRTRGAGSGGKGRRPRPSSSESSNAGTACASGPTAWPQGINDDAPIYRSDEFRTQCYKVLLCSQRNAHDW